LGENAGTLFPPRSDKFEHLSVCIGRLFLGCYERIAKRKYAAYDSNGRLLGRFAKLSSAQKVFDRLAGGSEQ
jgi:hypothetical protein